MPLHPVLKDFQARLERRGIVAVSYADYLEVRLPLVCCIRVRFDGERVTCDPYFGALRRTPATFISTSVVGLVTAGLFLTLGVTPIAFAVAFIALGSRVYDACRYVVTESYITRIHMHWNTVLDSPTRIGEYIISEGRPEEMGTMSAGTERVRVE